MNNNWNFNNDNRNNMRGNHRGIRGQRNRGFWPRQGGGGSRGSRGFGGFSGPNFGGRDFNQRWKSQPKRNTPGKRLTEEAIGVTQYISQHEGFNGIIKSRFSDFQVSEINEQGEVAKLTNLSTPLVPKDSDIVDDEYLLLNKYNSELLPMDTWDKINKVAMSNECDVEKVQVDVTGLTKEQRTKIHDAVKRAFGDSIVGSTVTVQDKKYVTFDKYRKGVRIDNRVKWVWPGEYVYFIVYKENCDTMEAASRIGERLKIHVRPSLLGYAGTKDRRAKTSQWFSLRKFDPRKIAAACRDMRDIRVGNYSFSDRNLRLGMLQGNQFRICLRNVTADDESVNAACALLKEKGFINYYGLQRFGTRVEVPTYAIGKSLLQGNFRQAIALILEERPGPMAAALHTYHTVSAGAALRQLPRDAPAAEAGLLRALAQNQNDLLGALDKVPRNARLLYIHSYQSLIWNRVVSERLQNHPHQPVPGDLVALADVRDDATDNESDDEDKEVDETDQNKTDRDAGDKKEARTRAKTLIPVKALTQEDCDSGRYSIFDVVLPLPGSSVEYPPNMKDYYNELLTKDELKLEMKNKYKKYSMSGGYRHMVARPSAMQWRCVRYSDPFSDLITSDADELAGNTITGAVDDGKFKALLLTLTLPASCYATMALRELLKADTSGDNQALQNNYHKKNKQDDVVKDQEKIKADDDEDDKAGEGDDIVSEGGDKPGDGGDIVSEGGDKPDEGVDKPDNELVGNGKIPEETLGDNTGEKRKTLDDDSDDRNVKKVKQSDVSK